MRLFRCGLGEAWSKEFCGEGGSEDPGIARVEAFPWHPRELLRTVPCGAVFVSWYTPAHMLGVCDMAYYKVLIEVWCDFDPRKNDLKEIAGRAMLHEGAICTLQEVIRIVHRPEDIDNSAALTFFGGSEGDADESQG